MCNVISLNLVNAYTFMLLICLEMLEIPYIYIHLFVSVNL